MERNDYLARKGKIIPLAPLLQQGRLSHDLALMYATEVVGSGFDKTDEQSLASKLALLGTESAARLENRLDSKAKRVAEGKAFARAKAYKRRLGRALKDLYSREKYEKGFTMPVAEANFHARMPGGLGKSSPKLVEYLTQVRPQVEKVKDLLPRYFDGGDALAQLDEVLSALKEADAGQELSRATLPEETLDLYQLKGEVVVLIERLNRAGRTAFDGDANKAALFNKDLLLRARRTGVEAVEEGEKVEAAS